MAADAGFHGKPPRLRRLASLVSDTVRNAVATAVLLFNINFILRNSSIELSKLSRVTSKTSIGSCWLQTLNKIGKLVRQHAGGIYCDL